MANTSKIKRSEVTGTPPALSEGELAYSFLGTSDALFIGAPGGAIRKIGGAKDVGKLAGIEDNAKDDQDAFEVPYNNGASTLIATDVKAAIDELDDQKAEKLDVLTNYFKKDASATTQTVSPDSIFNGTVTFNGEVIFPGTSTTVNSTDLAIEDNEIVLNSGETGAGVSAGTSGLVIERGTLTNARLLFDDADDRWKMDPGTGTLTSFGYYSAGDGLTLTGGEVFAVDTTVARRDATNTFAANQTIQGDLTGNGGNLDNWVLDGGSF